MDDVPYLPDSDMYAPFLAFREGEGETLTWAYRERGGTLHPIREVRILPMTRDSLPDEPAPFLTKIVPERGGIYYFYRHSIAQPVGALVLFQFANRLIGHALCIGEEKYERPDEAGHKGYFLFLPESIMLYEDPLTPEQLHDMDGAITHLWQAVQKVNPAALPALFRQVFLPQLQRQIYDELLADVGETELPAAFPEMEFVEGQLRETLSSRYERNPKARRACLQYYRDHHGGRTVCEICGFDFAAAYGDAFRDIIHVHHVKPVASFNGKHNIAPTKDLIPVCPNCHAVAHRRTPPYAPDEIRAMLGRPGEE